jgi:hypothetical protein
MRKKERNAPGENPVTLGGLFSAQLRIFFSFFFHMVRNRNGREDASHPTLLLSSSRIYERSSSLVFIQTPRQESSQLENGTGIQK